MSVELYPIHDCCCRTSSHSHHRYHHIVCCCRYCHKPHVQLPTTLSSIHHSITHSELEYSFHPLSAILNSCPLLP